VLAAGLFLSVDRRSDDDASSGQLGSAIVS
jgi:hypothetical protein